MRYLLAVQGMDVLVDEDEAPRASTRHWLLRELAGEGPRHYVSQQRLQNGVLIRMLSRLLSLDKQCKPQECGDL